MARFKRHPDGSTLVWLSARDTYDWAHRPGESWPCSALSDKRLFVAFDAHGDLEDIRVNGRDDADIDGNELNACVSDFLRARFGPNHPAIR